MKVAFGLKAHSGWAALVVIGKQRDELAVVDRRRIELVDEPWAKQPYHAAEGLEREVARDLVKRGVDTAHRFALTEMKAAIKRERDRENDVLGCSILVGTPMPDWNTEEILAVHFRMHKAEGVLFQNALLRASEKCKLNTLSVLEKELIVQATTQLGDKIVKQIAGLGKSVGPPWAKDQKDAALVALMALSVVSGSGGGVRGRR
ncbi:MAG TPA: hypothetical protein VJ656_08365 [Pyrinomonadaceae bacterium]|nr:hypothetical protein [Pyrinomonadaceae bacterium]